MNAFSVTKLLVRSVFLSIEAAWTLRLYILYFTGVDFFREVGEFLYKDNTTISGLTVALPVAVFLYAMKRQKVLLQPKKNLTILVKWPDYADYKLLTYLALLYCVSPVVPSVVSWMRNGQYLYRDVGFYYILLLGISLISVASLYMGQFKVQEILDGAH
jgi:hypothetical protein